LPQNNQNDTNKTSAPPLQLFEAVTYEANPLLSNPHRQRKTMSLAQKLKEKIDRNEALIAVVGVGYVGLPLAVEVGHAGLRVVCIDVSEEKTKLINEGTSYIADVPTEQLAPLVKQGLIRATTNFDALRDADAVSICVPTPLGKTKDPDMSMVLDVADKLQSRLKPGALVILESTTYPGTTREIFLPRLSSNNRAAGQDFFLAFSPERVDPGNLKFNTKNTPKIIGGTTPTCSQVAKHLYSRFIDTVVPVTSTDAAEMVKLLENTFRAVNIGLVNEVAIMCQKLGIDTWEVINAAATKPFGFMPFFPGPGLGGHCIPVDPLYLSWKLKMLKYNARFIELADEINSSMPLFVVQRSQDLLNDVGKALKGSKILLLGMAYKRDIDDVRESPALDIFELLHQKGAHIEYHDPYIPKVRMPYGDVFSVDVPDGVGVYDLVIIATDHKIFDHQKLLRGARLVFDTRNALLASSFPGLKIEKL
jgi:UDP-N-acetyl-D-glucosamine dehydrogenase